MYLDQGGKFVRTDVWREGKWLDLWSVAHFLSGVTMGFFPKYLGLEAFPAYAIALLLLVLYEMFEALAKIEETRTNRVMDVVVGMISFALVQYIHPFISEPAGVYLALAFLILTSVFSFMGWQASQKAAVFEAKLREEIVRGRERIKTSFREGKARLRVAEARFGEAKARRRMRKMKRKALRDMKKPQKP